MKHFNLIKTFLLLFALVVGGGSSAWAADYEKVTSVDGLEDGAKYLLVYENGNSSKALGAISNTSTKYGTGVDVAVINNTISISNQAVAVLTLKASSGNWKFESSLDNKFLYWGSGNSLATDATGSTWSVSYTNGAVTISHTGTTSRVIRWNNSSPRFACYTSGQTAVALYKEKAAGSSPVINAESNIAVGYMAASNEFSYTISNPVDNTDLTASVTSGGTWLSNAAVDAVNGKVTFSTTENEDEDNARVGTIHLVYGDNLATKDVTITQAVAPKKYTVTFTDPVGGTLVVKNGDVNVSSGSRLIAGTELTIVPTADTNYKYKNWQYKKGTGSWSTKTTNFSYTMDTNDVEFRANFDPTYAVNWSVNGSVVSTSRFAEGEEIVFPNNPEEVDGRVFVGWVADEISGTTDDEPTFLTAPTMGTSDVTYYAVFATAGASGAPVETKTQTLQYDTWSYSNGTGATTDKGSYRLFGEGSYIESSSFDLSKLSKVIVYGGSYGGTDNNSLTIGDGVNTWKDVTVSGKKETGVNTFTDGTALSGTKKLRVTSNSGDGKDNGVRISKVEIFTNEASVSYSDYCTTVAADTREAVNITSFTATETTLIKGNTTNTTVANDQAGWTAAYTYASDNTDVATVAADGVITAVGKGTANITVTLNVDKEDANYKKGTTFSKSIEITVNNPSHTVAFYDNGTKISETSVEEEAAIVFPTNPTPAVGGFMFEGWASAAIDGTANVKPSTVTEANMGAADINYYAVYGDVQKREVTATFDASDISNLTSVGTRTWKDNDTDIQLALSNGQHYTGGTPKTWTVTKGASNYFEISTTGALTSIVATISGGDYKINSVSVGSFVTNGTTQTVNKLNNATSVKCYATEDYQIRATEIVVKAIVDKTVGYVTTLPTNATITISSAGYATYCSSVALDFTGITTLTAYTASKDNNTNAIIFNKVEGKVPANTGLLVSGETTNVPVCASADPVDNLLVGVTTETVKDANTIFVLMNGSKGIGFYKNSKAFTLRANSAYLPAEAVETAGARTFIGFDDDTTGIAEMNTQKEDAKRMFDLQGRKVTKTAKGLYIVDGRKVVVK